ncbi:hypothetical protein HK405_015512, partial [Cladochytrium tenue]
MASVSASVTATPPSAAAPATATAPAPPRSLMAELGQDIRRQFASAAALSLGAARAAAAAADSSSALPIWITAEKNVVKTVRSVARDQAQATKALSLWGKAEANDLRVIMEATAHICSRLEEAELELADQLEQSRKMSKEIKAADEQLSALHRRQRDVRGRLDSALSRGRRRGGVATERATSAELIRGELNALDMEVLGREAAYEGFKRERASVALRARWDAYAEFAARLAVAAEHGRRLAALVPRGAPPLGHEVPVAFAGADDVADVLVDHDLAAERAVRAQREVRQQWRRQHDQQQQQQQQLRPQLGDRALPLQSPLRAAPSAQQEPFGQSQHARQLSDPQIISPSPPPQAAARLPRARHRTTSREEVGPAWVAKNAVA